eukprot:TRINITY_DN27744_c0_g1_i1.p1 TRINITY_DN27744_c0_g1~~TRINITY_DN27744_c0_g1_i1.p1  ORF type:complete len:505 (+),score=102.63 TRINITY_DN27744_c0_g1_i1:210-1517(+)
MVDDEDQDEHGKRRSCHHDPEEESPRRRGHQLRSCPTGLEATASLATAAVVAADVKRAPNPAGSTQSGHHPFTTRTRSPESSNADDDSGEVVGAPRPHKGMAHLSSETLERRQKAVDQVEQIADNYRGYLDDRQKPLARRSRRTRTLPCTTFTAADFADLSGKTDASEVTPCDDAEDTGEVAATTVEAAVAAEETTASAESKPPADGAIVIFDWDDTLFPTWFVTEVVKPCLQGDLDEDSPFYEALSRHAELLRRVLTEARSMAKVAIITLAQRPWVLRSAERFLPGLNMSEVLAELDIPVYYARENIRKQDAHLAQVEEGVDVWSVAKRYAMRKCLKKMFRGKTWRRNVVSIGDSPAERQALQEVLWFLDDPGDEDPLCKTVKLIDEPTLPQLDNELHLLLKWLSCIVGCDQDFDISMDNTDDLDVVERLVNEQ